MPLPSGSRSSRTRIPVVPSNDIPSRTEESSGAQNRRLFGTIYLWRPKQKIFFRSLYLWGRDGSSNEYFFGTNESICNVVIKNTETVASIHAKICFKDDQVHLAALAKERILKVCLPSVNPELPQCIKRGSQRGSQVWYVDDVEYGHPLVLEDWSVFSVEKKVFMIRIPNEETRARERDEIAYCFGEESTFNKVFGLVHQLKKCDYTMYVSDGLSEEEGDDEDAFNEEDDEDENDNTNGYNVSSDDDVKHLSINGNISKKEKEAKKIFEDDEKVIKNSFKRKQEISSSDDDDDDNDDDEFEEPPRKKIDQEVVAPEGMLLRYVRRKTNYDVKRASDIYRKYHIQGYGVKKLTLGMVKKWGVWTFAGVFDPKRNRIRKDLKPVVK